MKHIVAGIIGLGVLGGCINAGIPSTQAELPPPPPLSLVEQMMTSSYNYNGVAELYNVNITRLAPDNFIGRNQWDYFACATLTVERLYAGYRSDGSVVEAIGSPRDLNYVMHLRQYDTGWGSGIFRRTGEGVKLGRRQTLDLCPA